MTVKEITDISGLSPAAQALVQPDSVAPAYLDSLEKQQLYQDAIKFLAHKMAVDMGVKWACACVRELQAPELKDQKNEPLEASEQWARSPSDTTRRAAKDAADKTTARGPANLVAMAVFFSGGSIVAPTAPEVQPPPYTAQKMIAGSVQIAVVSHLPAKAAERYERALAVGKALDQEKL
jgi:hypothetical protein